MKPSSKHRLKILLISAVGSILGFPIGLLGLVFLPIWICCITGVVWSLSWRPHYVMLSCMKCGFDTLQFKPIGRNKKEDWICETCGNKAHHVVPSVQPTPNMWSTVVPHKKVATVILIVTCVTSLLGLSYYYVPSVPVPFYLTSSFTTTSTRQGVGYEPYATYVVTQCAYSNCADLTVTGVLGVYTYATAVVTMKSSTVPPSMVPGMVETPIPVMIAIAIIVMALLVYGILYVNVSSRRGRSSR